MFPTALLIPLRALLPDALIGLAGCTSFGSGATAAGSTEALGALADSLHQLGNGSSTTGAAAAARTVRQVCGVLEMESSSSRSSASSSLVHDALLSSGVASQLCRLLHDFTQRAVSSSGESSAAMPGRSIGNTRQGGAEENRMGSARGDMGNLVHGSSQVVASECARALARLACASAAAGGAAAAAAATLFVQSGALSSGLASMDALMDEDVLEPCPGVLEGACELAQAASDRSMRAASGTGDANGGAVDLWGSLGGVDTDEISAMTMAIAATPLVSCHRELCRASPASQLAYLKLVCAVC